MDLCPSRVKNTSPHRGGDLRQRSPRPVGPRSLSRSARMLEAQWRRFVLVALLPAVTACGPSLKAQKPTGTPTPPAATRPIAQPLIPAPPVLVADPVHVVIAASDPPFKARPQELQHGHVEAAT